MNARSLYQKLVTLLLVSVLVVLTLSLVQAQESTDTPETMGASISEEAAQQFSDRFDAMFDGPNLDIADEIFAPEFVSHLPLAPELDLPSFKAYVASFYDAISDLTQEVHGVHVSSDRVILHVSYTGTHDGPLFGIPATGNQVVMNGIGIFEFNEEGLAVENWAVIDVVGLLAQVGAFPPTPPEAAASSHVETVTLAGDALATGETDILDELLADDYVVHGPLGDLDQDGLVAFFAALRGAMTDLQLTREQLVIEGDFATARNTISGIFSNELTLATGVVSPNDQPVQIEFINMFQFNDEGQIVEEWVQFDNLSFLTQIGVIPPAQ